MLLHGEGQEEPKRLWGPVQSGGSAPLALRLKAVKLYLEEGLPSKLICRELGIHKSMLYAWVKS